MSAEDRLGRRQERGLADAGRGRPGTGRLPRALPVPLRPGTQARAGLRIQFGAQLRFEPVIAAQREGPVAGEDQGLEEREHRALVEGVEGQQVLGELAHGPPVPAAPLHLHESSECLPHRPGEALALGLDPLVEARGAPYRESLEEIPPPQRPRLAGTPGAHVLLERRQVQPDQPVA